MKGISQKPDWVNVNVFEGLTVGDICSESVITAYPDEYPHDIIRAYAKAVKARSKG